MKNEDEKKRQRLRITTDGQPLGTFRKIEANINIDLELSQRRKRSARKNELYVVQSSAFKSAIEEARKRLGYTDGDNETVEIIQFVAKNLKGEKSKTPNAFQHEVRRVLTELHLSDEWRPYVASYIARSLPPEGFRLGKEPLIEAEEVDEKGSVVLRLRPGLSKEDYLLAWNAIKDYLGEPERLKKPYTNTVLNEQVYQEKLNGLSYSKLAEKHFPNIDRQLAIDRLKKIVKRERQRYKAGTKLGS
jgi:hypothetical protein